MGLHDVSKNHGQRLNPRPNSNDEQKTRMAHNTYSPTNRTEGSAPAGRVVFKNGLLLTYDVDNNISSVYGYIPDVSDVPVLIIAKEGLDVYTDVLGIDAPTV